MYHFSSIVSSNINHKLSSYHKHCPLPFYLFVVYIMGYTLDSCINGALPSNVLMENHLQQPVLSPNLSSCCPVQGLWVFLGAQGGRWPSRYVQAVVKIREAARAGVARPTSAFSTFSSAWPTPCPSEKKTNRCTSDPEKTGQGKSIE